MTALGAMIVTDHQFLQIVLQRSTGKQDLELCRNLDQASVSLGFKVLEDVSFIKDAALKGRDA